jgi:4-amino-4-deoxy-L-arabinose transferase-like glycosyltransferase
MLLLFKKRPILTQLENVLAWMTGFLQRLGQDTRLVVRRISSPRVPKSELILMLALTLAAAWLRLYAINQTMRYDESYTYASFASKSVWKLLSDYHLPNNHVLHTLLVHYATLLVGSNQPWAVRIPAFAAGVLMVPALYVLARRLFDRPTAIISACLIIPLSFLISYSTNARGYTLVTLLALLAFWAGSTVLRHKNRFAWAILAVLCALGFFTVPIMLYPFGCLMVWLFASALLGDIGAEYTSKKDFLVWWLAAGLATALLTLVLYAPILANSGPRALFGNKFVAPVPWGSFPARLKAGALTTWKDWFSLVPARLQIAAALAFFVSLILPIWRGNSKYRVPTQLAAIFWIVVSLLIQRPQVYSKVWTFLLPLFLMWCAAGLVALLRLVHLPDRFHFQAADIAAGCVVAALCVLVLTQSLTVRLNLRLDHSDARSTMVHLKQVLQPGDVIVVSGPNDAPLQYYAMVNQVPESYFYLAKQNSRSYQRVFVVVAKKYHQSMESVLKNRDLNAETLDIASKGTESDFGIYTVYRISSLTH